MKKQLLAAAVFLGIAGTAQAQTAYSNPYYTLSPYLVSYGYYAINLKAAQTAGYTGKDVKVAVFDTGLFTTNPKFAGNLVTGYNIFTGGAVTTDAAASHGTFVSSIIGANMAAAPSVPNIYGVAPLAKIMPIQLATSTGAFSGTDKQVAEGIKFATANGARIFNNSWNNSNTLTDLYKAYGVTNANTYITKNWYPLEIAAWTAAANKGILNVWAAGNNSKADPGFYASLPNVVASLGSTWVTVVATDQTGKLGSFSNACGLSAAYCIAAPGEKIIANNRDYRGDFERIVGSLPDYSG